MATNFTQDFPTDSWVENTTDVGTVINDNFARVFTVRQEPTNSSTEVTTEVTLNSTYSTSTVQCPTMQHIPPDDYEYVDFSYGGYPFERPFYLYIWEILAILVCIVNIIVVSILLSKKMRNPTNVILAAIAISDSLTGMSTLPTYIMVFSKYEPAVSGINSHGTGSINYSLYDSLGFDPKFMTSNDYPLHTGNPPDCGMMPNGAGFNPGMTSNGQYHPYVPQLGPNNVPDYPHAPQLGPDNVPDYPHAPLLGPSSGTDNHIMSHFGSNDSFFPEYYDSEHIDGYHLSKSLCEWFMISKFFISKSFHTISIYLTVFLGVQRFISVALPFKMQSLTTKRAVVICILISVLSPFLHVYHLTDKKATDGNCEWGFKDGCQGGCIEMWVMFFLRNLIPCGLLLTFTVLFIRELHKGENTIRRMDSTRGQIARRVVENRRIAIIVIAIVIVFLIPEIPFGFYLLYNAIDQTANEGKNLDLKTNRAVHMAYELLLLLSFHANFYIYVLFNRKFRRFLLKIFVQPVRQWMGDSRRISISSTRRDSNRRTEQMSLKSNSSTKNQNINQNINVIQDRPKKKSQYLGIPFQLISPRPRTKTTCQRRIALRSKWLNYWVKNIGSI